MMSGLKGQSKVACMSILLHFRRIVIPSWPGFTAWLKAKKLTCIPTTRMWETPKLSRIFACEKSFFETNRAFIYLHLKDMFLFFPRGVSADETGFYRQISGDSKIGPLCHTEMFYLMSFFCPAIPLCNPAIVSSSFSVRGSVVISRRRRGQFP